eukprot:c26388_g1_i1.p2 GENE.c26388_g1_i1~~c26388_g1_i1.p2  ORF type:complete len:139 (+),score=1.50 c26388_g1_i1:258-674(+)
MLMQEILTKRALSPPTAMMTAHINKAVVMLSAMGEIKKANIPVIQNSWRRLKPLRTNQERSASNTSRSSMAFTYVIATNKNKNNSAYSNILCRTAFSAASGKPSLASSQAMMAQIIPEAMMTGLDLRRCKTSSAITSK